MFDVLLLTAYLIGFALICFLALLGIEALIRLFIDFGD